MQTTMKRTHGFIETMVAVETEKGISYTYKKLREQKAITSSEVREEEVTVSPFTVEIPVFETKATPPIEEHKVIRVDFGYQPKRKQRSLTLLERIKKEFFS